MAHSGCRTSSEHRMDRHKAVRWLCWIAFVAAPLPILVLAAPHLVNAYHLEAGGWALDNSELLAYNPLPALDIYKRPSNGSPTTPRHTAYWPRFTARRVTFSLPSRRWATSSWPRSTRRSRPRCGPCVWPTWLLPCRKRPWKRPTCRWTRPTPGRPARRGATFENLVDGRSVSVGWTRLSSCPWA